MTAIVTGVSGGSEAWSVKEDYPELEWLKGDVKATQEGVQTTSSASIEHDRTMLTLKCLALFFKGDAAAYQEFTLAQKEGVLTQEAFKALHQKSIDLARSLGLEHEELHQLMEAALVLGDMGKTATARGIFWQVTAPDHDDFEKEALQILKDQPHLCPTFERLSPRGKEILLQATGLAHYGHIYHIEGGPEMFTELKSAGVTPEVLGFALFVQRSDVAGALAHIKKDHSITFNQKTYEMYELVEQACNLIVKDGKGEQDAYNYFLQTRGQVVGFSEEDSGSRVLTRVAAMLRLFSPEEGKVLSAAFAKISQEKAELIAAQFGHETFDPQALTPTYIPAVLLNLMNNKALGKTREERLEKAVEIGLPIIAKALEAFPHKDLRACFNDLAGQAKQVDAAELIHGTPQFDGEGNVTMKLPSQEGMKA